MSAFLRLFYWLFFGLVPALLPVGLTWWKFVGIHQDSTLDDCFLHCVKHGEILLISLTILGINCGDLLRDEVKSKESRNFLLLLSFVAISFATMSYSEISDGTITSQSYMTNTTNTVFFSTLSICIISQIIPKK